jgi:pyrimidine-nucleoside phosphorylase
MLVLGGTVDSPEAGKAELERRLRSGDALRKFAAMIRAQGGDDRIADHPERLPAAPVVLPVPAATTGVIAEIDATAVGLAAMRLGAGRAKKGDPIDPAVGVILAHPPGTRVRAADALAHVHARTDEVGVAAVREVATAIAVRETAAPLPPLIREVIT